MAALPCFRSWLLGDLRHKTQRMLGLARGGERLSNRRGQAKIQFSGLMINKTTIPQMALALFLLPFPSSSSYSSSWPASSLSPFSSSSSLANGLLQLSSWSVQRDCLWTSMNTDIVTWGEKVCRRQNFEFHPCCKEKFTLSDCVHRHITMFILCTHRQAWCPFHYIWTVFFRDTLINTLAEWQLPDVSTTHLACFICDGLLTSYHVVLCCLSFSIRKQHASQPSCFTDPTGSCQGLPTSPFS